MKIDEIKKWKYQITNLGVSIQGNTPEKELNFMILHTPLGRYEFR